MKRKSIVLSALAVALIALLYWVYGGGSEAPPGQPALVNLHADNFAALKTQFNDSRESVRVILLLSPT
jgi:hypothetical protein